jgi:metal-sulfur cluster biosynthetic enzyme
LGTALLPVEELSDLSNERPETPGRRAKSYRPEVRMPTQEQVYEALKEVEDPELQMGIVDLGLVYGVAVDGAENENVAVTMTLTSPMCPVGPMFKQAVLSKVESLDGVKKASVEITFTPPWDPRTMASDDAKVHLGIW